MITSVFELMNTQIITIAATDGVCKAREIMLEKSIGCLPVLENGSLVGILTLKDIANSHPNRIVADAMTASIISVTSNTSLWKARETIENNKVERLLVIDDGKLVGLITKTQLFEELGKHLDLLTGLYGSDYIYHHSMELIEKGVEISVIFIDIDKFGYIDKEFGHTQGDTILKEIAFLLKSHTPDEVYLCRFGGDEFVVLTPFGLNKCKMLADDLLKAISSHDFCNCIKVTASAGIAGGRHTGTRICNPLDTVSDLINLASLASTKAKREKLTIAVSEGFDLSEIA